MGKGGLKFKFKELRVWQKGNDLAIYIYRTTNRMGFRDYGGYLFFRSSWCSVSRYIIGGESMEWGAEELYKEKLRSYLGCIDWS